jgi:pyrimidine-nucleoside phosphorylase
VNVKALIRRKRLGKTLTADEIRWLVRSYTAGAIPDYQLSAFLMAVLWRGMDADETLSLTRAMIDSGRVLSFPDLGVTADKHSTGGVGDKVSLILAPAVASAGLPVPMLSGRGLGHTGGTLDKLESIPGLRTSLSADEFASIVRRVGCVIGGQSAELAPADGRIYALRDATETVESVPLIAASILSKKCAAGPDVLVLDVKVGRGAFMRTPDDAADLARFLVETGARLGRRVVAVLTDMNRPLGRAIGNAIEVREAIAFLRDGEAADDLREITLLLASVMLVAAGKAPTLAGARDRVETSLRDGTAYARFRKMVEAQGGDLLAVDALRLPLAPTRAAVPSPRGGFVADADALELAEIVMEAGGGRRAVGDPIDASVGIWLERKPGDPVSAGEPLATLHLGPTARPDELVSRARRAFTVADSPPDKAAGIYGFVGSEGTREWRGWETRLPI